MKLLQQYLLFLLSAVVFVNCNKENDNWPPYLLKCERNTSDVDTCIYYHAKNALKYLYPGDPLTGMPRLVPYSVKEVTFGTNKSFKLNLYDAEVYGYNYISVDRMKWNFEEKHISIGFSFTNSLRFTADYTFKGTFKDKVIDSSGRTDITFLDGEFTYDMDYTTEKINGYEYASIDTCKSTKTKEYPRFYFTPTEGVRQQPQDLESFIQKNNIEFNKQINPDAEVYICKVVNSVFEPIFFNFPMELIFDQPTKRN